MTYSDFVLSGGKMMTVGVSTGAHALSTYAFSSSSGTPVWTEEEVEKGAALHRADVQGPALASTPCPQYEPFLLMRLRSLKSSLFTCTLRIIKWIFQLTVGNLKMN